MSPPRRTLREETLRWRDRLAASCETSDDLLSKCEVKDRAGLREIINGWTQHVLASVSEGERPEVVVAHALCWSILLGGHLEREGLL